jgi:hypothetical protein
VDSGLAHVVHPARFVRERDASGKRRAQHLLLRANRAHRVHAGEGHAAQRKHRERPQACPRGDAKTRIPAAPRHVAAGGATGSVLRIESQPHLVIDIVGKVAVTGLPMKLTSLRKRG